MDKSTKTVTFYTVYIVIVKITTRLQPFCFFLKSIRNTFTIHYKNI